MVALYDSVAGSTTVVSKNLAPGDHAFAVLHDANGSASLR